MEALAALASSKSKRLPEIARALVKLCEDCVAQCEPVVSAFTVARTLALASKRETVDSAAS